MILFILLNLCKSSINPKLGTRLPESIDNDPPDENPDKIFVCEGDSCQYCESENRTGIEIQLINFSELEGTLSIGSYTEIEIIICGSTRQNHPSLKAKSVYEKKIKLRGERGGQFLTVSKFDEVADIDDPMLELVSENVTVILDDPNNSKGLTFFSADLLNSPIECKNLIILNGYSDLFSLSSVSEKLYAVSLQIYDAQISQIRMGVDFIDFITFESNSIVLREYDISMDIQLYLKQNRLDFIADSTINKAGTENNIVAIFDSQNDEKVTVNFDSTWNSLDEVSFVQIKYNGDIEISSDKDEIAQSIEVYGNGKVTRNGKIDDDRKSDDGEYEPPNNAKSRDLTKLVICCLIIVVIILIAVAIFVFLKKKCKKKRNQNYNEYLNNDEDLADMNAELEK